ncbi:MAG: outer membrane protein transport protein, partial [Verrucomicrobiota bacterium]
MANFEARTLLETETESTFRQVRDTTVNAETDFEQEGGISAGTIAMSLELNPKLSIGFSFNEYFHDLVAGRRIRSSIRSSYTGDVSSRTWERVRREIRGSYAYDGVFEVPGSGAFPPFTIPISGSGFFPTEVSVEESRRDGRTRVRGDYLEINEFTDLDGRNLTLGLLYSFNNNLSVGASIDLPWTADMTQRRLVRTEQRSVDANGRTVSILEASEEVTTNRMEMTFPAFGSLGVMMRPKDRWFVALDLRYTGWSSFSFQPEGAARLNPLDGSPHATDALDDTWSVHLGTEVLFETPEAFVPLRGGLSWE